MHFAGMGRFVATRHRGDGSVAGFAPQCVAAFIQPVEQLFDVGMAYRAVLAVGDQVLLADIV